MMKDVNASVVILRTLSMVLFLMALGMLGARIFAGLDISAVIIMSMITVGASLMMMSHAGRKKPD